VIPSEDWAAPYRQRGLPENAIAYYAMIAHLDAAVGRLMDRLDSLRLGPDTLVIFQTDNGHAVDGIFNAGMRGMKGTPYEGGIRVPAFWRWPGRLPAGTDCAALTAHVLAAARAVARADERERESAAAGASGGADDALGGDRVGRAARRDGAQRQPRVD
jgi:arylsulfatase